MSSADARATVVLCAGIAVLDMVFRVERFPQPDVKTQASEFRAINGGCAANAAVAIAQLGGARSFAGPLGGPPATTASATRAGARGARGHRLRRRARASPASPRRSRRSSIDARGERTIVDLPRRAADGGARRAMPTRWSPMRDAVIADNRFPEFVRPICAAGACARHSGRARCRRADARSTIRCSRSPRMCLFGRGPARDRRHSTISAAALSAIARADRCFLAVTDGPNDVLWLDGRRAARSCRCSRSRRSIRSAPATASTAPSRWCWRRASDAVAAMRFAAAAAALKCTRFGGISGAPDARARSRRFWLGKPTREPL